MIARAVEVEATLFQDYTYFDKTTLDGLSWQAYTTIISGLTPEGQTLLEKFAWQPERQPEGERSKSFLHSMRVGGLVLKASGEDADLAVAAALHDMGKSRDDVRELTILPRRLSDEERAVVSRHSQYGHLDLEGCLWDKELEDLSRFVALNHHTKRPAWLSMSEELLWDYTSLTQIADRTDALLLDWERTYKADRMTAEGLLHADGTLNMDATLKEILREDVGRRFLGIKVSDIVEIGHMYMPKPDWIQEQVALMRQKQTATS